MELLKVKAEKSITQRLSEFVEKLNPIFPEGKLYSASTDWRKGCYIIRVYISNYKRMSVVNKWNDIYIKQYNITESKLLEFLEHAD